MKEAEVASAVQVVVAGFDPPVAAVGAAVQMAAATLAAHIVEEEAGIGTAVVMEVVMEAIPG